MAAPDGRASPTPIRPVTPMSDGVQRPQTPGSLGSGRPRTPQSQVSRRSTSSLPNAASCPTLFRQWMEKKFVDIQQSLKDRAEGQGGGLWQDVNALKDGPLKVKKKEQKYADTWVGQLAGHRYFEAVTMVVILLNALAIGVDTDYTARFGKPDNLYEGPIFFIVSELSFAAFFTIELLIRFFGYKRKRRCFTDSWFLFDSFLVLMMDVETFILPFIASKDSPLEILSILRLLRLLRVSRMAKLMKTFPELMLIVKGLAAAVRAVSWTLVLLMMILFVWSIVFTSVYHQGNASDEDVEEQIEGFFGNMSKSMFSLIIMGTLLDDVTLCSNKIRESGQLTMLAVFIVFIVVSSFMMLNMLLGILVEVVANTAEGEKRDEKNITVRKAMIETVTDLGAGTGGVTKEKFMSMSEDPKVLVNMKELDIKAKHLQSFATLLYESQDSEAENEDQALNGEDVVSMLFRLQPGSALNFSDLASTEKTLLDQRKTLKRRLGKIEQMVSQASGNVWVPGTPDMSAGIPPPVGANFPDAVKPLCTGDTRKDQQFHKADSQELSGGPRTFGKGGAKVSLELLAKLSRTDTRELVDEIRRRLGCEDLESTGVPMDWFDDDMKGRFQGVDSSLF